MDNSDKINNMYNQSNIDIEQIIEHVKANREILANYILDGIDNGYNVMLVSLVGDSAFKRPAWFSVESAKNGDTEYNAQKYKDKILNLFKKKSGQYGYGILLGEQPGGFSLVCIDIDADNECKENALNRFIEIFEKHNTHYYLETTKSGRYHIYVAVDKIPEELRKIRKISFNEECIKYKEGKQVPGEIELLGASSPHVITVYNGIINNEKPVFNEPIIINSGEQFLSDIIEFLGGLAPDLVDKLAKFYKLIREKRFYNGWDIDRVVSAFCVKNQIPDSTAHQIFKEIYGDEYKEKETENLLERTKGKPDFIPGIGSVIYHIKEILNNKELNKEETEFVKDFHKTIIIKYSDGENEPEELPDYLVDVENVYLVSSRKKQNQKKGTYYKEKYFVERLRSGVKEVLYIELESKIQNALFEKHELINDPEPICVKVEILRFLKEKKKVAELLINDEFTFIPSFNFERLEDIAIEISTECFDYIGRFDIPLFQKYLSIKIREYRDKHGGKSQPCLVSKTTGWNEDLTMFFHYDLNDDKHELSKDNPLYKHHKAQSSNQDEQHKLVYQLLQEGKLLSVLFTISTASIMLKPLNLQPLTCILAGHPGAGKTTASLIATSLFYKSDTILLNANTTNVGFELMISSLNSLPFVIDEGALADTGISLKNTIFSVASGKGRTRGRKDLTVDTKDINSNVLWTTETTDVDDIKRSGAFRRMLYLVVERWEDFTNLFAITSEDTRPNEKYAGCGVDYIKFAIANIDKLTELFIRETRDFGAKYGEITGIAGTLYAGIILLEEFYKYHFNLHQDFKLTQLRQKVNAILEEVKRVFIQSKDNIVEMLNQYLYNNNHRLGIVEQSKDKDGDGVFRYDVKEPTSKEMLGEYDKTTQTYYISISGFKTIAKELEKERTLLINVLVKAGVMDSKESIIYHSKVTKAKIRVYKLKFPDPPPAPPSGPSDGNPPPDTNPPTTPDEPNNPDNPNPTAQLPGNNSDMYNHFEPTNTEASGYTDEPDDALVDAFSTTTSEKQNREKQAKNQQAKRQPSFIPQPVNTQQSDTQPVVSPPIDTPSVATQNVDANNDEPDNNEQSVDETNKKDKDKTKEKIVIKEDTLDIHDVKLIDEIPKYEMKPKNIKAFSKLVVGSLDIETTGLEGTDQIIAIAFNVYKNGELQQSHKFYVNEYNNDDIKMVSAFLDTLKQSSIDVLTGYNLYDFDLRMIKAKDKNNRLDFTSPVNISGAMLNNNRQLQGYCIRVDGKYIEVIDAMHLVIKYDNIVRDIPAQNYDLKSVAKHFGISKDDRVVLGADEILKAYENNKELLEKYHGEDVREAYEIFKKLAPPYYYIRTIVPFEISFFNAFRSSTASIWERILENSYDPSYKNKLTADEKKSYEGGLVINNKGFYRNVYKIDVASLYPNIMLNYQIHSRKDEKKIALSILNKYTNLRLQLKKQAKAGDKEADLVQNSLKILINSLYGFYGTGGYPFNDMEASAYVTAYGRRILKEMINYVEANGGIIIECDTDGIFYSAENGQEIYEGLRKELNEKIKFDIELEYKDCVMYASDKKNYIIIETSGKVKKKGSKYAGRDKNKLQKEFVVEYIKRYIEDKAKAEAYKKEIRDEISLGKAFDWLKITRKVAKNDKTIINDAKVKGTQLEQGSIVSYVYKDYRKKSFTFEGENSKSYDIKYYLAEFEKLVKEIDSVIKSSQQK